ncbi:MAG: cache domain-containing protein, partial [Oryzomonas sp.]
MAGPIPMTAGMIASNRAFMVRLTAGVLLINLFVVCLTGFSLYRSRQQYESRVAIQTQNLAQSLSLTIDGIINQAGGAIFSVAQEMERQIRQGGVDGRAMHGYILQQQERIPELDGLRVANARGETVHGDRVVPGTPISIADREWFIKARNTPAPGLMITKPMFGRHSKHWVFNIARRINNPDGSFAGIAYASISLDYLLRLFSSFDLGKDGIITLRDGELTVIVRYPEPRSIGSTIVSPEMRAMVQAGRTSGTYTTSGSIDATKRVLSFHKVDVHPLYINVGRSSDEYLAPWRYDIRIMLLLATVFAAGSLAAAL